MNKNGRNHRPKLENGVPARALRAALYVRLDPVNGQQDSDSQLAELRQFAARRSWRVTEEYIDYGAGGARELRPALNRLLDDARRLKFEVVLVWKIERFARSLKHLVSALAELGTLGVGFVSVRDRLDLSLPVGRHIFQMIGAMADFERMLIEERAD